MEYARISMSLPPHVLTPHETAFSNILASLNIKLVAVVVGESVFVSCVFMEQYLEFVPFYN